MAIAQGFEGELAALQLESLKLGPVMGPEWGAQQPTVVSNPVFVDVDANGFKPNKDTLDFPLPDALTRLALWQAHLGDAGAAGALDRCADLERVALRCALSGGQIRNAALHATLLALDKDGAIGPQELRLALEREYRKAGQQCPSLDEVF